MKYFWDKLSLAILLYAAVVFFFEAFGAVTSTRLIMWQCAVGAGSFSVFAVMCAIGADILKGQHEIKEMLREQKLDPAPHKISN